MQDINSVITEATKGYGERLAELYDISVSRLYQKLEADNYGKTKKLIRFISFIDKDRVRIIKADLDAMFAQILGENELIGVSAAELHSELSEAINAKLANKSKAERLKECRDAKALLAVEIECLERGEIQESTFGDLAN